MEDIGDLDPAALLREATRLRTINMDAAIACLRRFNEMGAMSADVKNYLRLPLYLQKAGRFEEAKREFQLLLDTSKAVVDASFSHQSESVRTMLYHARLYTIYDKMRLVYEREGLRDIAEEYSKLYDIHNATHQKMMGEVQEETRLRLAEWKEKKRTGRAFIDDELTTDERPVALVTVQSRRDKMAERRQEKIEQTLGCLVVIVFIVLVVWAVKHFVF